MGNITEAVSRMRNLMGLNESEGFNPKALTTMKSFRARVQYCTQYLGKPIGTGSSRIVFDMGDKVLKLAKNPKGLEQNDTESDYALRDMSIVSHVIDNCPENMWMIVEKAMKAKPSDFEKYLGVSFQTVRDYLDKLHDNNTSNRRKGSYIFHSNLTPEQLEEFYNSEWGMDLQTLVGSYDLPVGDLQRLNSWGIVNRNGTQELVLIDYGLTFSTYDSLYLKEFDN